MILEVRFDGTVYNELPYKFEAGTPNIAGVVGLGAAVDYLSNIGLDRVAAHEHYLLDYLMQNLEAVDGVRLIGTAKTKASVQSFEIEGVHPHDVGTILDHQGIAIRTGHHCAMPVMDFFGVPGTARASLALYNTVDDVDKLVAAVEKAKEIFGMSNISPISGDDVRDLYRELILDHARSPRHFGKLENATHSAAGINPLCGDKLTLYVELDDTGVIREAAFEGSGCAISVASASLLTETVKGLPVNDARRWFDNVTMALTSGAEVDLGKLQALVGVREFPSRVKCATLSWHALNSALENDNNPASTE